MKNKHLVLSVVVAFAGLQPQAKAASLVDLGSAGSFAVLAGSGITVAGAVGSTTITGDIGTYPTPTITGPGNVVLNGVNQTADAGLMLNAPNALTAAFSDAAGRPVDTTYPPIADLGG